MVKAGKKQTMVYQTNRSILSAVRWNINLAGTYGGGVFVSINGGESWKPVNMGLSNKNIYSLIVSGTNVFAGTSDGVFVSSNDGKSWSETNYGLTNKYVYTLLLIMKIYWPGQMVEVFL